MQEKKKGFMQKANDALMPVFSKIAGERHIRAISAGLMSIIPFTLLAAIVNILKTPPVTADMIAAGQYTWLAPWVNFATKYNDILSVPYNMTMGMMALIAVIAISYQLAESYKMKSLSASLTATIMFLMIAAPSVNAVLSSTITEGADLSTLATTSVLSTTYLGASGLFVAMITALCSVEITRFCYAKNLRIKMPDAVPEAVGDSFSTVIPLLINAVIFYGLNLLLTSTTGMGIPEAINTVITPAVNSISSPAGLIGIICLGNLFWLFGIHGPALFSMLYIPVQFQVYAANAAIAAAGQTVPFTAIDMTQFSNGFFGLNLVLLFAVKSKQLKALGKATIIPGIFLISEPLIFGVPLMFNPILAIPLIFTPAVTMLLSYIAGSLGIITGGYNIIFAQLPLGLNAYFASMNIANLIFYFVMIVVQVLIWLPFVKVYDRQLVKEENEREQELKENA